MMYSCIHPLRHRADNSGQEEPRGGREARCDQRVLHFLLSCCPIACFLQWKTSTKSAFVVLLRRIEIGKHGCAVVQALQPLTRCIAIHTIFARLCECLNAPSLRNSSSHKQGGPTSTWTLEQIANGADLGCEPHFIF